MTDEHTIVVDIDHPGVAVITLNRPHALNALSLQVMRDLTAAAASLDADPTVKAIVITGSAKAFAAGADIKEMADRTYSEMYAADWFGGWSALSAVRTPLIAAVAGYALGGGCELAMMCDILIAADTARFGQPEITLGVIPGMGGSQRLTRAIGKAKAMDLCLTGRAITADEAERAGLVSRVVPAEQLLEQALQVATRIASMSAPAARMVKEAVNRSFEVTLAEGLLHERRLFHATFATDDQTEGMAAFIAKRPPLFTDR
ncbi:enoyl-CoA hydratase [Micromonospora sp. WMMD1082]|uniref:enoyl-CoA hydratase n=1 Tax=Micromonospora sp. WMMD1082 TaxID=3016104 RepID=UPI002415DB10|nr:enoyl-CoA hydratase [Micromonospora sp. WMMD1082]MDG4795649.1 enoyl-CoA hydratase [Micromonospora sp. WMMD1082]